MEDGEGWMADGGWWSVDGGWWMVEGGGWRVEGGGWRVEDGTNLAVVEKFNCLRRVHENRIKMKIVVQMVRPCDVNSALQARIKTAGGARRRMYQLGLGAMTRW